MLKAYFQHSRTIRTRCLATLPLVAIAGAALGVAVERAGDASSTMLWFAAAMCVGSYVSAILEAATLQALRMDVAGIYGDSVALAWDLILGALTGLFLSRITSVGLIEAAGAASGILFMQRLVLEKLILGNAVGDWLSRLLIGGSGGTEPQYSHAAALAARGDIAGARAEYEQAIAATPREVRAHIGLARMLRDVRDFAAAASVLERAIGIPGLEPRIAASMTRELAELQIHHLNAPGRAATMLARYISNANHTDVEWARALLRIAKSEISPSAKAVWVTFE